MFLSIVFAIFVWPAIAIAGIVCLIKTIAHSVKGDEPDSNSTTPRYNIRYETAAEEERRTAEYGYDDPKWGKL